MTYDILSEIYEESPPRSRIWLEQMSIFWVTSHISPKLLSCAPGLK